VISLDFYTEQYGLKRVERDVKASTEASLEERRREQSH
jgi:hypothetical protein